MTLKNLHSPWWRFLYSNKTLVIHVPYLLQSSQGVRRLGVCSRPD